MRATLNLATLQTASQGTGNYGRSHATYGEAVAFLRAEGYEYAATTRYSGLEVEVWRKPVLCECHDLWCERDHAWVNAAA